MAGHPRARTFTYDAVVVDPIARTISCRYRSDDVTFEEVAEFGEDVDLGAPGVGAGAELYFLLAGLSYYKTGAAHVVDLGEWASGANARLLSATIRGGLAEFAYRNGLDLESVDVAGRSAPRGGDALELAGGPLIPFGGGIDSIVTASAARGDAALFVVGPRAREEGFAAIERPAAVTGLPVVRCARTLDAKLLDGEARGWLNGHVPVTAIVSALAVTAAAGQRRGSVVMSNERSASAPNLTVDGRSINHQWSKSWEFEELLRQWLASEMGGLAYYSALRDRSELWVAREFAGLTQYANSFMSCNRAFRQDPARRATTWCGECDKCLFIDLVLAPFVGRAELDRLFSGREPIADLSRIHDIEVLVGLADNPKPFECVGDADECATALVATAARSDRADQHHLADLARRCGLARPLDDLLIPAGPTNAPEHCAAPDLV